MRLIESLTVTELQALPQPSVRQLPRNGGPHGYSHAVTAMHTAGLYTAHYHCIDELSIVTQASTRTMHSGVVIKFQKFNICFLRTDHTNAPHAFFKCEILFISTVKFLTYHTL